MAVHLSFQSLQLLEPVFQTMGSLPHLIFHLRDPVDHSKPDVIQLGFYVGFQINDIVLQTAPNPVNLPLQAVATIIDSVLRSQEFATR